MRKWVARPIVSFLAVLALSSAGVAQDQAPRGVVPPGFVAAGIPEMPNPPGPAPKHDLNGAWIGPFKRAIGPYTEMTPAGKAAFALNRPVPSAGQRQPSDAPLRAANDPFTICDPLGFPRDLLNSAISSRGGIVFEPAPNRMLMLFEQQRVYREVWTDGRQLPAKVDAAGAPDSRFYGYSVGHWEGDDTFVVDTTGLDDKTWLNGGGYPHSIEAHVQERYTRPDHNDLQVKVTVDDPKLYTKPFVLGSASFRWLPSQQLEEQLCIPSQMQEYLQLVGDPGGSGVPAGK
jgi:hypothetical protein